MQSELRRIQHLQKTAHRINQWTNDTSSYQTFEYWTDPPDRDGTLSVKLAEDELHVEEGEGPQPQHHRVRDEECAAPIFVAQVGEPPHRGQHFQYKEIILY